MFRRSLALLWMIGWALFDFARALRRLPSDAEERWVLQAAIAVIVSVLVSGWYSWNLNNSEVLAMFLAVMGCGYVAMWQARGEVGEASRRRYNRSVCSTVRSIENCDARSRALPANSAQARGIGCGIYDRFGEGFGRFGWHQPTGCCATSSGRPPTLLAITGIPKAMARKAVKPQPSEREGMM